MKPMLYVLAAVLSVAGSASSQVAAARLANDQPGSLGTADDATSGAEGSADSATSQKAGPGGYGSAGYGGRAEGFVSGFGLLANDVTGNSIVQSATKSGGGAAGYRFHLSPSSAFEGRYGFSRNSQKYTIAGVTSSIPTYLSEITASYVYRRTEAAKRCSLF